MIVKWILVAWWTLGALIIIASAGEPRKPVTPKEAAIMSSIITAQIVLVIFFWRS